MLNTICMQCGIPFMRIKQRGRPREYCTDCRPSVNRRPDYGQTGPPKRGRRPDYSTNDAKRSFQAVTYKILQEIMGSERLADNRSLASLCNDQSKPNNQLSHLLNTIVSYEDQFIGFDLDEGKIIRNGTVHNQANWYCADMCSEYGLQQMSKADVKIIDFDPCGSVKNKRVIDNLTALFQSTLLPRDVILMINIRVRGVRDKRFVNYNYDEFIDALAKIPGYKDWELRWTDTYVSDQDGATYRTVILVRKKDQGNLVFFLLNFIFLKITP